MCEINVCPDGPFAEVLRRPGIVAQRSFRMVHRALRQFPQMVHLKRHADEYFLIKEFYTTISFTCRRAVASERRRFQRRKYYALCKETHLFFFYYYFFSFLVKNIFFSKVQSVLIMGEKRRGKSRARRNLAPFKTYARVLLARSFRRN